MNFLEEKILTEGKVVSDNVLNVDSFLNHQLDAKLLSQCGKAWYDIFHDCGITKILTIESKGIAVACMAAQYFNVPVLFAKRTVSGNVDDTFHKSNIVSYTHGHIYDVIAPKEFITKDDKVLILDDFLANGSAMKALITLAKLGGAQIVGCGAVIEKVYLSGGSDIRSMGYRVESLAKISSISNGKIEFC